MCDTGTSCWICRIQQRWPTRSKMRSAAELDSPIRTTPAPADAAILSYEPGTVDTDMQAAARSRPLAEYPWGGLFRDFAARGTLVAPTVPASEIVEFLE